MYSRKKPSGVTIHDVAKLAGVTKSTVSRFLNQEFDSIAVKTRKKIEEAISELNYRPNMIARGLKSKRSNVIAMLLADIRNPYSTAILRGAEEVCQEHNYTLMLCNSDNNPVKEQHYFQTLYEHRVDGMIINSTGQNQKQLRELAEDGVPIVLLDREVEGLSLDTISTDNYSAIVEAMQCFLDHGYEHFACFSEHLGFTPRMNRVAAFRETLQKFGNSSWNEVYELDLQRDQQIRKQLLAAYDKGGGKKTLFVTVNGMVTLKLIQALQQERIAVPDDIAVAGFDDLEWAPIVGTGITTIAQDTYGIGRMTMECLLERIGGDESPAKSIKLPGKLILRGSTPRVNQLL